MRFSTWSSLVADREEFNETFQVKRGGDGG